jgi:alanine racemase
MALDMVRPGIALYGVGPDAIAAGAASGDGLQDLRLHHQDL